MVESTSDLMDAIGGYFELELQKGKHYHDGAIRLNTARNCFEYILLARGYRKVYIPYYTCEVILEPLKRCDVSYEYYSLNEFLEPSFPELPTLHSNESFLYTNYYGLKQTTVNKLVTIYGSQLIIDNSQAFFASPIKGIDMFYSARKFFGVPDGAYLYTDAILSQTLEQDDSWIRMQHLLQRIDEGATNGYAAFREADESLSYQEIKRMSRLTDRLLENVNYQEVKDKRLMNYNLLHDALKEINQLKLSLNESAVPMVYPFWTADETLRKRLIENKIFVATYWPNVFEWCNKKQLEYKLTKQIIPLPIDQRYGEREMERVIKLCLK